MFDAVDTDRMLSRLDALWEIGETPRGGVTRLAYSEEETEAIEYIRSELPDGYDVRTDSIGNVFATRAPDAEESLFLGSHLDSVFNGGKFDGTLGVVTALEAIEAVHASDAEPAYPPTLTVFRAEESARFGQATIGSRGALGLLTVEDFAAVDDGNVPLWQAMQQAGFRPSNLSEPTLELDSVAGFLEAHPEQGRVLEEAGDSVGLVTSIRAPVRHRVRVLGNYDHSGATPMGLRRDALAGAAEMITAIERIAEDAAQEGDLVATVGDVTAVDGAVNKVCGEVEFLLDVRSNDEPYRDDVESTLLDELEAVADRRGLSVETEPMDRGEPVELDEDAIGTLEAGAAQLDVSHRRLPSGGGHDAMNFQLVGIPTGMVFAPSVDGISHNPDEDTPPEAIGHTARVLAYAITAFE